VSQEKSKTEIRFLAGDDAAEYSRLRLEALESELEAFSSSAEEHRTLSLDEIRNRLGAAGSEQFVVGAFAEGQLAATAGFYREKGLKSRHKGYVWGVYVAPKLRGTGVGRKIMQKLIEQARTIEGVEQIQLSFSTTQTAAERLYRSLGFQTWGCEPRALKIGDRYIDEEFVVLRLNQIR
jgi:ribosomal protein S18 acetylase RimI-like enzyme